ncbi:hypothetical protein CTI12_AA118730 [Artemisia annua]|uniref:Dehydrin n=1 Tax=Artemisia annua TaxID=35608 RepID=A0A2U1PS91_ARTAN|nr:hypothetical protein CTI12_AA118730 [Artemisia annua]
MAGIMNKIGDALHIGGGNKDEDNKKKHEAECADDHKKHETSEHKEGEKKEGIVDKIKDKIHGDKDGEKSVVAAATVIRFHSLDLHGWSSKHGE